MVLPGEGGGDYMTTTTTKGHERPKALHNFGLLNWGTQRHMRCVKLESDADDDHHQRLRRHRRSSPSQFDGAAPFRIGGGFERNRNRNRIRLEAAEDGEEEEGIEEFREKIMSDLRTVADKMTKSILGKQASGLDDEEEELETRETEREVSPPEAPGTAAEARPWNLRKRREASCKAPVPETGIRNAANQRNYMGMQFIEEKPEDSSKPRRRLTSVMSKKEIEDDFMKMIGQRPSRRPKKRPRTIQKQINMLHPAYYMYDITEDLYKITDPEENRKR
ncbi:unnamed protein product [Microthlaspi erraticum]|uniref:DUF1639 domain-containing protein n=1 Tax=Microthlaspi erraticum TaxID=1685480 RepID=A0A6D2KUN6_9BRAS|nr:unnamed protein product [Microthlaspi erraticum]